MAHLSIPGGLPRGASGRWVVLDVVRRSTGRGRVRVTTLNKNTPTNTPVRRRVRLDRDSDGAYLRELWTNATTGQGSFDWLDPTQTYTATAYDHTGDHVAVSADKLVPEPMP